MNITDFLVPMAQIGNADQPGLFPFSFKIHVIFSCIAFVFLLFQFIRQKRPYQAIMAVAIPASLIIWLSESRTLFYGVGIMEIVFLLAALVTSIVFRDKSEEKGSKSDDKQENSATEEKTEEA